MLQDFVEEAQILKDSRLIDDVSLRQSHLIRRKNLTHISTDSEWIVGQQLLILELYKILSNQKVLLETFLRVTGLQTGWYMWKSETHHGFKKLEHF